MAYVITRLCERCDACMEACPNDDTIFFVENDPDWPTYYINPETCIECGSCEEECEQKAIFHENDVPTEYEDDIQRNVEYFESGPGENQI